MDVISWFRGFVVQLDHHDTIVETEQRTEALKTCDSAWNKSWGHSKDDKMPFSLDIVTNPLLKGCFTS